MNKHCDKAAPKYLVLRCTPSFAPIFQRKENFLIETVHLITK